MYHEYYIKEMKQFNPKSGSNYNNLSYITVTILIVQRNVVKVSKKTFNRYEVTEN